MTVKAMQISSLHRTNLAKTLSHGVSERSAASHNDRRFSVGLSRRPLALAEPSLSPATLRIYLSPVHWHRHRDNQGHHGGLSATWTIFLLRRKKEKAGRSGEMWERERERKSQGNWGSSRGKERGLRYKKRKMGKYTWSSTCVKAHFQITCNIHFHLHWNSNAVFHITLELQLNIFSTYRFISWLLQLII